MLKITPLGGLGEIGLNMMVVELANTMILVDAGLMFPEDHMLGVDCVIPDISYIKASDARLAGIILTHAHEDHIGALPYLMKSVNAPIFGTPFTLGVVEKKLDMFGLRKHARLYEVTPAEQVRFSPFAVSFVRVSHSVVDGVGLAIQTPYGTVVHTGDFRINSGVALDQQTDVSRFRQLGEQGVLLLMSDSTNVEMPGRTLSDHQISQNLYQIAAEAQGRIIVALFASSIVRIQQIIDIAVALGRKVAFSGRSLEISTELAKNLNHLRIPEGGEVALSDVNAYDDNQIVIITTGSQGEPMSALARMAGGTHSHVDIRSSDKVILSSKFIPGNERAIAAIINRLYRLGADVVYDKISDIHVSGHAYAEELKEMIRLTRPVFFMPIHGEYRHLVLHARLAKAEGVAPERVLLVENGQQVVLDQHGGRCDGPVPIGRVMVDGKGVGDVGRSILKERRILSEDGIVAVTVAFDEETGTIVYGPEVVSKGFVFKNQTGHLIQDAQCVILETVEEMGPSVPLEIDAIRSAIVTALRQYFFFTIGRRPLILPFILKV